MKQWKMETNEEQVTRNIKACRTRHNFTQEELAKKMNVTKNTYINIENNPFSYDINKLNEVALAIECNIDEFFMPIQFT